MKVEVALVRAFVDGEQGGNPAGVVLNADHLSSRQKLAIADKVGLSETAFVSKSEVADFKLDFFTPKRQIAHCGHATVATVATFGYLAQKGFLGKSQSSKETIDGARNIIIKSGGAYMEQLGPTYKPLEVDDIHRAIGITPGDTLAAPMIVNTGNAFFIVGVKNIEVLNRLTPNYGFIEALSEKYDLIGLYVFTRETNHPGRDASTRMFAPRYGIAEESATGMAAGPLACYLHDYLAVKKNHFVVEQGYSMIKPSPSCINVELKTNGSLISSLNAGGISKVSDVIYVVV
ncbi:PhzF family phenazine biosynthesis protein [Microbulbifer sp. A4B17]|uniref:PhzF family phenazine biosynthesis protein n=1 Tax=Microbulbifer sp. A4B17 TaxID=359370 RepID=UPI000D52CFFE|nr:PhzF family phenazine biosynthesis protein [Microbulbifer sp. A4B17]AWF81188.1 PhzF family phenazine biosynthesis protein [Microbulbifer sp. A4B17]